MEAPPDARLIATFGSAVEPLVHAPEAVQSARVGGIGVIHDAVVEDEGLMLGRGGLRVADTCHVFFIIVHPHDELPNWRPQANSTLETMTSQVGAALPAWAIRLTDELNAADETAKELMTGLTPEQLNWQPEVNAWSVGQCLEHLCRMNEVYLPAILSALLGKSSRAVSDITPGWFGRWFIRSYIEPSPNTKRAPAPKMIVPGARVESSVLDRFLRTNQAARELVRDASNCDVNRIRFRNPFIPIIRFTVGTGLEIVSKHERRHLLQAQRAKSSSGFPASERKQRFMVGGRESS
jgi:DinB superfamily